MERAWKPGLRFKQKLSQRLDGRDILRQQFLRQIWRTLSQENQCPISNSTSSQPCWNHWNQNVSFWLVEQTCHNRVVLLFGYVLWDTVGTSIIPNTQRKRAKYLRGPPRVAGPTWTIEVGNGWLMAPAPTFGTYIPFGNQTWLVNRVYSWENH
jgi:hypothetical protein